MIDLNVNSKLKISEQLCSELIISASLMTP